MNQDGNTSRFKLILIRAIGTVIIIAICLPTNDVSIVTEFAGNLFNPLVSFAIPIIMVHSKAFFIDYQRKGIFQIFHDTILFLFSIFMMGYGTYKQIHGMIYGK